MCAIKSTHEKKIHSSEGRVGSRIRRDNLTPEQRSYTMARIKSRGTALEKRVMSELKRRGLRFRTHVSDLPGRPDVVFGQERLAVFIDGDFWHGYRFPNWCHALSPFWQVKIAMNKLRDKRNAASLRRQSWAVVRIWQHQVKRDLNGAIDQILAVLATRSASNRKPAQGAGHS